jgi:hypothetical protein
LSKKITINVLATLMFALIVAFVAVPGAQAAGPVPDIDGHWAELQMEYMLSKDKVSGYPDASFKPANTITRAEFMKIVNNAAGLTATVSQTFTDVSSSDWFAPEVDKAVAAGYVTGYPDGSMKPNASITRQEAAVMMAKATKLDLSSTDLSKFKDAASIPDWSKGAVAACSQAGYINGYPDGTFQGAKFITRAEAIVIALNTMPEPSKFNTAGTFGPEEGSTTITGDVIVTVAGVNLINTTIEGNLLIAQNVGEGSVGLSNVLVKGISQIDGGGANSIYVTDSELGTVLNYKPGVRIYCSNGTTIVSIVLDDGSEVVLEEGSSVEGVIVSTDGLVTLTGEFSSIVCEGMPADVTVNGSVDSIKINSDADGSVIRISSGSTVSRIVNDAEDVRIIIESSAKVSELTANASTEVTGNGTINNVINPQNTNITKEETQGGGGGGTTTPPVAATAIAMTVNSADVAGTVSGTTATVDLSSYNDADLVNAIKITAPANSTLTVTTANDLSVNKVLSNLDNVTAGSLMPGTSNTNVRVGTLRNLFGPTLTLTGTLSCTGYANSTVTLTINLSATAVVDVTNEYFTATANGTTIDATIKAGKENNLLKNIGIRNLLLTQAGQIPTEVIVSGISYPVDQAADLQLAIAVLAGGTSWNDAILGGLDGKTIQFKAVGATTYNIVISQEPAPPVVPVTLADINAIIMAIGNVTGGTDVTILVNPADAAAKIAGVTAAGLQAGTDRIGFTYSGTEYVFAWDSEFGVLDGRFATNAVTITEAEAGKLIVSQIYV